MFVTPLHGFPLRVEEQGSSALPDVLGIDHAFDHILPTRYLVHGIEQGPFHDSAQAAGAGFVSHRFKRHRFKRFISEHNFDIIDGDSAIVPVMLYDAKLSQTMADMLLERGIYVIGFFYPVVPKDKARIRVQLSAAHTKAHIDKAVEAFVAVGNELNII